MEVRVIPELSSMILTLIAVVILFWGLSKLLYKPVTKILNDRKEGIQKEIDGAKELREDAHALKTEYEIMLSNAKKETQGIIESGRNRGEEIKASIIAEAKGEAESIVERAKKEIQLEREKALLEVKTQAGELAVLIASKIIEKDVDLNFQENLIEKFADEVGKKKWHS